MPCHKIPLMPPLKNGDNWQLFSWHKSKLCRYNFRVYRIIFFKRIKHQQAPTFFLIEIIYKRKFGSLKEKKTEYWW